MLLQISEILKYKNLQKIKKIKIILHGRLEEAILPAGITIK